ncbi:M48 family metalloprotease [Asanoa sp. NPDC050611]|uniref:M48 family metalloprotease n=1 Tax=Asanoa sp. NPDC050611 TaxID=3157098 RepID=UPI0033C66266
MNTPNCPRCAAATTTLGSALPWCPGCEWNLDAYDGAAQPAEFGWRWVDRRLHRMAFRLAQRQFAALVKADLARKATVSRFVVVSVALVLYAVFAAMVVGGVLLVLKDFLSWWILPGAVLLALAWLLRPRLGRLDDLDGHEVTRDEAPNLFALLDEVAGAVGTTTPPTVLVDGDLNAYTTAVGFRRRRVLGLGLPLWAVLEPQERVALLGHEFGHFVNSDRRRSLLVQPALRMLGQTAMLLRPGFGSAGGSVLNMIAEVVSRVVMSLLSKALLLGQIALLWIGLRDGQRAEYQADGIAARVAGTTGAIALEEVLAAGSVVHMLVARDARAGNGPATWRASVADGGFRGGARTAARLQLSIREEASLFATHPPAGLRARMMRERAYLEPAVRLTPGRAEAIDAELTKHYEAARRDLKHA